MSSSNVIPWSHKQQIKYRVNWQTCHVIAYYPMPLADIYSISLPQLLDMNKNIVVASISPLNDNTT